MSKCDAMVNGGFMVSEANFQSITQYLQQFGDERRIPPLEQWHPQYCGAMDLVIKANGQWWHEGQQIRRQKLIDLFSKVLWQEDGEYYLKTPVEKIKIQVEDAPLLIVAVDQVEIESVQYLQLTTQNQDIVLADSEHSIFMRAYTDEQGKIVMRPYLHVRFGLTALIQRNVFYHLLNYGELIETAQGTGLKLKSGTAQFILGME